MNETFDDKMSMLKVKTYVRSGRATDAIGIYEKLLLEKDSIFSREMRMQLDELNTLFHVDELKMQNSLERSRYLLGIAVLALLVVLALMLYFYSRYRAGKRLEREHQLLLESNEKLERGYEELQAANARAEESSRMKAEFIKNISHEIRTPLNILNGFTQIVAMPGVSLSEEEMSNAQKEISENSNRITQLVNKMLELSEASSTLIIERTDDASVEQIAAMAADMAMVEQVSGPVAFETQIPDGVGQTMLRTNLHYASRVLELLLGNAMKFTREGRVTLSAALTPDGRQVAFAVEDTGIGIPPEEAEHIFQEFVQLDSFADGTGIGLTVARTMARRMNGDLTLDTTYTGGARFVFTLPV
ncbi:MAG: HAMP domain-containing histidine kinase [Prevotella sp.]|nr:HAMP domain-containing histidine kinase [Prevotella sp.]